MGGIDIRPEVGLKDDNILRLLIVDPSEENAEHSSSVLRNAGIAVRPTRAADEDRIKELLESQPPDMILCAGAGETLPIDSLTSLVGRSGRDVPIIAQTDSDPDRFVEAMRKGARDVVFRGNTDHLQLVVQRELDNLTQRRNVRKLEAGYRESEKRCNALLDSSRDAIAYVHEGMHVYANKAYLETFGFDAFDEIEGMPILDMVSPDNAEPLKDALRKISKGEKPPKRLELQSRRLNGETFDSVMEFSTATIEGEPCTQIVVRDQAMDPDLMRELTDLRTQDLATGLCNRQYFLDELDRAVNHSLEGGEDGAVIYIELDDFRAVINQVGIAGTDLVLSDVAKVIKNKVSEHSLAGRFGDHSFAVLVQGMPLQDVEKLGESLRKGIEENISEVGKRSITLTCSIGMAAIGASTQSGGAVLSAAADVCADAQKEGGNRVEVYNPVAQDQAERKQSQRWLKAIQEGLTNDRFALVFQPIVSLHGAAGEYYEVLLRLENQTGELVAPTNFLPVAEQNDLMGEIDRWVISHAIEILAERASEGHKTTFFVKITPESAADPSVLTWLADLLKQHRVHGDQLVFEMPESRVVTHMKPARQFVEGIKQLHCGFALEQFGSGLNSFQLLKHLPADYLKIDRSFMKNLSNNQEHQEQVKEVSDQAHAIGKITIAEFVEDAASMAVLYQVGVNFVQGNFLQEPEKVLAYDFGE